MKELPKEIEALDEQIARIRTVVAEETRKYEREIRKTIGRSFRGGDAGTEGDRADSDLVNLQARFQHRLEERVGEILLPSQIRRLNELAFWAQINRSTGFAFALTNERGKAALEIGDRQAKKLKQEAKRLQPEFERRLFALRQKYRAELKEQLPEEQRKKLLDALGDPARIGSPVLRF